MTGQSSPPCGEASGSPWLISEAAGSCEGTLYGPDGGFPSEVVLDSREVRLGSVFVALKGQHTDGHLFLSQAFERGARLVVAEKESWLRSKVKLPSGQSLLLVEGTTRDALLRLARRHLDNVAPREVIAITGSVGKTTTREVTATLLRDRYRIHVAQKSYNTDVGCALTVLGMPADTEILILEMGCNHPGEIKEMVDWFPPTRAIITEVGPSHLEGLKSVDGVLRAKLEILQSKRLRSLSFNSDNDLLSVELAKAQYESLPTTGVGWSRESQLRIASAERETPPGGKPVFKAWLEQGEESASITYSLFGLHHARNIALALSVILAIGDHRLTDLKLSMESPKGRGRLFNLHGGGIVVDDSYNANPLSVRAALQSFETFMQGDNCWLILGGMKELGEKSSSEHAKIAEKSLGFSKRIFVGQEWDTVPSSPDQGLWFAPDGDAAIEILQSELKPGSFLLVKGSRAYRLERIVDWLVNHFES